MLWRPFLSCLFADPVRGGRGVQHHQGVDREHDRRQQLRPLQGQQLDQLGGGVVFGLVDQVAEALQVHRHVRHHAEKRRRNMQNFGEVRLQSETALPMG